MMLADGDMSQYDLIKRMSVGDYLIKLNNYVQNLERQMESNKRK